MCKTKNDLYWERIFEKHNIVERVLNNNCVRISATEINEFREARLMTKFDHRSQLPKLFLDNNLSILPVSRGEYMIGSFETFCDFDTIQQLIDTAKIIKEPETPFPQADSFERVINLCELLKQKGFMSKEEITQNYDFDYRQTDYYTNAGKYLGLINVRKIDKQVVCCLTESGLRIFNFSIYDRQFEYIKLILSHIVFKEVLKVWLQKSEMPTKSEIVEIMKNLYKVDSESTYFRRASTVTG
jgi:hypothetical protein